MCIQCIEAKFDFIIRWSKLVAGQQFDRKECFVCDWKNRHALGMPFFYLLAVWSSYTALYEYKSVWGFGVAVKWM